MPYEMYQVFNMGIGFILIVDKWWKSFQNPAGVGRRSLYHRTG